MHVDFEKSQLCMALESPAFCQEWNLPMQLIITLTQNSKTPFKKDKKKDKPKKEEKASKSKLQGRRYRLEYKDIFRCNVKLLPSLLCIPLGRDS